MPWISGDALDYREEMETMEAAERARERAGLFRPFSVRRVGWLIFAQPDGMAARLGRWAVFYDDLDLASYAPSRLSMPYFFRFETACRVAHTMQRIHRDLTP
jgi:hypothetical protein